ncbi:MAG: hypothetical protein K6T31_07730, partial [Alicyclobacillus sp.]|nr:hypothetical protein [Alicyclobacillus sp.]
MSSTAYGVQALVFLLLLAVALGLFYQTVRDRVRFLLAAAPDPSRRGHRKERWRSIAVYVLGQRKVLAEPSGLLHVLIFWGFLVLVFGDLDFIVNHLSGWHLPWALSPVYA